MILSKVYMFSGVTQASFWFIKDVHRQSEKVAELTTSALLYMAVIPLIEALVRCNQYIFISTEFEHSNDLSRY